MEQILNGYKRIYVNVDVRFDPTGMMMPRRLTWTDGRSYEIDKVLEVRPAYAQKAGGQGDRCTIRINGRQSYLIFERNASLTGNKIGRWFVEKR